MTITGNIDTDLVLLDDTPFEIIGAMQGPSLLTPFADKVTIGEATAANDVLLSSWVLQNFRGGLGVANLDEQTQVDRYRFGSLWALQDKEVSLLPLAQEITLGIPASTESRIAETYNGTLYVAFNAKVRYLANVTSTFTLPPEGSYVDLGANATDAVAFRMAGADWLVFADGAGVLKFNGTTWTYTAGNGSTLPQAQWLEPFDGKLYVLDVNGRLWRTSDLTTWTALTGLPVLAGEARGLDTFFDPDNRPALHAPARDGLYLYVTDDDVWQRTRLRFPHHATGGDGHCQWRDEYYVSAGLDAYHYQQTSISPATLARDDGLPADYAGDIAAFCPTMNWLVAAVNGASHSTGTPQYQTGTNNWQGSRAPTVAGLSALYLWTGSAWQPLWVAASSGTAVRWLHYSTADSTTRLYWGSSARVYYLDLPNRLFNPREVPTWQYAEDGYLESGRFDAALPEHVKVAVRTRVRVEMPADGLVQVVHRIDRQSTWHQLGFLDTSGLYTFVHDSVLGSVPGTGDAAGLEFYDWEYRFVLSRSATTTLSPRVIFVKLEYITRPAARFGYRFQCRVADTVRGQTAATQAAALQALAGTKTRVAFEYRPTNRSPVTSKVLITAWTAITIPGMETQGTYLISVADPGDE